MQRYVFPGFRNLLILHPDRFCLFSFVIFIFLLLAVLSVIRTSYASVTPQVSAGGSHNLALKGDGTIWGWGSNVYGQLGSAVGDTFTIMNGTTAPLQSFPVPVSTLSDVTAVTCGYNHSLVLKSDGTVWACGSNSYGQLGDGSTTDSNTLIQVSDLADITDIAGGQYHSLALKSDGTVWAWGSNSYGQLGDGSYTDKSTPGQILNFGGIIAIACGETHNLALKSDGTVWAWGRNDYGQLGDGTTSDRNSPKQISSLSDISAIAGGAYHSLALKSDGTVWAWGFNLNGQLGDETNTPSQSPVQVSNLSDISAIDCGSSHSLALESDGTVWAWGLNWYGQLGNGSTTDSNTPVQVRSINDVTAITSGMYHNLALKSDGKVWAWGYNSYYELGEGTSSSYSWYRTTPVQAKNLNLNYIPPPTPTPSPSPSPSPTPSTGDIEGVVVNAATTDPIPDARVVLDGTAFSIRTGTDGTYKLPIVEAGNYTLTAPADGFMPESKPIVVEASAVTVANFSLQPVAVPTPTPVLTPSPVLLPSPVQKGSISGYLTDLKDNPVKSAKLMIKGIKTKVYESTFSDASGVFEFADLDADTYMITARKKGYRKNQQRVTLEDGESKEIEIVMKKIRKRLK